MAYLRAFRPLSPSKFGLLRGFPSVSGLPERCTHRILASARIMQLKFGRGWLRMTLDVNISTFSSSELVLLHPNDFAKPKGLGGIKILSFEQKVDGSELVRNIAAAAFLAAEAAGDIKLEIRTGKALFGLRHPRYLSVDPGTTTTAWPEGSLESRIRSWAASLMAKNNNSVKNIVYSWLAEDVPQPWHSAIVKTEIPLVRRGLLTTTQNTTLKVFKHTDITLPVATAQTAGEQPITAIQSLLSNAQTARADVWNQLISEVNGAISLRTESSSDTGPD